MLAAIHSVLLAKSFRGRRVAVRNATIAQDRTAPAPIAGIHYNLPSRRVKKKKQDIPA